jgi:hypothetical protein
MVKWKTPVIDRTAEDVTFAKQKIAEWITAIQTGEYAETFELKGCLNVSDLNRIEGNIKYLNDMLGELGYPVGVTTREWGRSDIPTTEDVSRIINNVREIILSYYQQEGVTALPSGMGGYNQINAIEENLLKIKELLDCMINSYQRSGAFTSDGMRMLPIRR